MYGVLYAVSPELFPTRDRGTGNAIVSAANHTTGVIVSLPMLLQISSSCLCFGSCRHHSWRYTGTSQRQCRSTSQVRCSSLEASYPSYSRMNPEGKHQYSGCFYGTATASLSKAQSRDPNSLSGHGRRIAQSHTWHMKATSSDCGVDVNRHMQCHGFI